MREYGPCHECLVRYPGCEPDDCSAPKPATTLDLAVGDIRRIRKLDEERAADEKKEELLTIARFALRPEARVSTRDVRKLAQAVLDAHGEES